MSSSVSFATTRESADRLEALSEPTGMALRRTRDRLEPLGDRVETFVTRRAREARVHLGVLIGLADDRGAQVLLGRTDRLARHRVADDREEVEVPERVPGLAFGDRAEQRRDLGMSVDVGLLREVEVATVRLALARERGLQVLLGLAALQVSHCVSFPSSGRQDRSGALVGADGGE